MPYLFLLFVIMPIVEIAVLIQVGGAIGGFTTIAVVILTAIVGTTMLRQQGIATLHQAQARMQQGEMPAEQLLEGLLLLVGGILLLTPGFITDFFGFCVLIPPSRRFIANFLAKRTIGNMNVFVGGGPGPRGAANQVPPAGPSAQPGSGGPTSRVDAKKPPKTAGDVIEGDYKRLD